MTKNTTRFVDTEVQVQNRSPFAMKSLRPSVVCYFAVTCAPLLASSARPERNPLPETRQVQRQAHGLLQAALWRYRSSKDDITLHSDLINVIALDPSNGLAHFNLGVISERLQLWDKAKESYEHALCTPLPSGLVESVRDEITWLRNASSYDGPRHTGVRRQEFHVLLQAALKRESHQPDDALELLGGLIHADPRWWEPYVLLALTLLDAGRTDEAYAFFSVARTNTPASVIPALDAAISVLDELETSKTGASTLHTKGVASSDGTRPSLDWVKGVFVRTLVLSDALEHARSEAAAKRIVRELALYSQDVVSSIGDLSGTEPPPPNGQGQIRSIEALFPQLTSSALRLLTTPSLDVLEEGEFIESLRSSPTAPLANLSPSARSSTPEPIQPSRIHESRLPVSQICGSKERGRATLQLLQIGTFSEPERVTNILRMLNSEGLTTATRDLGRFKSVLVGPVSGTSELEHMTHTLNRLGLRDVLIVRCQ